MKSLCIILLIALLGLNLSAHKKNSVFEVPSKKTKSILDIKQFVECAKAIKDFPEYSNFLKVLEHKKGYKKQLEYIKRIVPHNKEATLCKKSARKAVPMYLDDEKFAL